MPGLPSLLTALNEGGKPDGSLAQKAVSPLAGMSAAATSPAAAGPLAGQPVPAPVGQAPTQGIDPRLLQLILQALANPGIGDMPQDQQLSPDILAQLGLSMPQDPTSLS